MAKLFYHTCDFIRVLRRKFEVSPLLGIAVRPMNAAIRVYLDRGVDEQVLSYSCSQTKFLGAVTKLLYCDSEATHSSSSFIQAPKGSAVTPL